MLSGRVGRSVADLAARQASLQGGLQMLRMHWEICGDRSGLVAAYAADLHLASRLGGQACWQWRTLCSGCVRDMLPASATKRCW